MTRYLVGIDGSAASASAVRWAADLAEQNHATLLALHVGDADPTARLPSKESAQHMSEQWLEEVSADARVEIELELRDGDPREVLRAVSDIEQPDLVILGRGGDRVGVGPEHLGRVAGYTARHNAWPLAVIPVGARHHPPRIVVGVDGSAGADAAVVWCAHHLATTGTLVIAVDVVEHHGHASSDRHADERTQTDAEIASTTAPLTNAGIDVEPVSLLHQHPVDALLHVADARHADVIVIGTRGSGGFDGLHLGGTALKLLRRARVPLVLVPQAGG